MVLCIHITVAMMALGSTMFLGLQSALGEDADSRDPRADGTVHAVASAPSVVYWLGESTVFVTSLTSPDDIEAGSAFEPRVVGYKAAVMNGVRIKRGDDIVENSSLESGVFKNPGPYTMLIETFDAATGNLETVQLDPGFGIVLGDPSLLLTTHKWGCACTCGDGTNEQLITLDCNEEPEEPEGEGPIVIVPDCNCDDYNGQVSILEDPELSSGVTSGCFKALVPNHWE